VHRLTLTLTLVLLPVARAAAQHQMPPSDSGLGPVIHGRTFSTGTREGWTFSTPHLDINGGLFEVHSGGTDVSKAFVRSHLQTALGIHQVGKALTAGNKVEFLIRLAHPLAPYKLHFP